MVQLYLFSYSKDTLHVRMNAFSTLFGMSGWRAPWSNTKPRIRLQTDQPHQVLMHKTRLKICQATLNCNN